MLKNRKIIFYILLATIVISFFYRVFYYRSDIFERFDSKYWADRYQRSQWVVSDTKESIGDDGLYAHVGDVYVRGVDPSTINAELPPLGKYFIGFFENVTGYMGIFSLFFSGLSLIFFYLFNRKIFKSSIIALIPIVVFSFDRIFYEQIRAPFLDSMLLATLLLTLYLVISKKFLIAGLSGGIFLATKSPFLAIPLFLSVLIYVISKKVSYKKLLIFLASAASVYVLSYIIFFLKGNSFLEFLSLQKFILNFYLTGAKGNFGSIISLITVGHWSTWWGSSQFISEWTPFWTVSFILSLFSLFKIKKIWGNSNLALIATWIFSYILLLITAAVFPRYLLLLLPFMYNLAVWVLFEKMLSRSSSL